MEKTIKELAKSEPIFLVYNTLQRLTTKYPTHTFEPKHLVNFVVLGEYLNITIDDVVDLVFDDGCDIFEREELGETVRYLVVSIYDAELAVHDMENPDLEIEQLQTLIGTYTPEEVLDKIKLVDSNESDINATLELFDTESKGLFIIGKCLK